MVFRPDIFVLENILTGRMTKEYIYADLRNYLTTAIMERQYLAVPEIFGAIYSGPDNISLQELILISPS